MVPQVFSRQNCETLVETAEKTKGGARQQTIAVIIQLMQQHELFTDDELPEAARFHGLRTVLAKAQKLREDESTTSSGAISSLLSLFASLHHKPLALMDWQTRGRMRIDPSFYRSAVVCTLKPPTARQLEDTSTFSQSASDTGESSAGAAEPQWDTPVESVAMLLEARFERPLIEFCMLRADGDSTRACDMLTEQKYGIEDVPPVQQLMSEVTQFRRQQKLKDQMKETFAYQAQGEVAVRLIIWKAQMMSDERLCALNKKIIWIESEQKAERMKKEYLQLTVDKCAGLKALENMSTNDPYVKVILKQPDGTIQEFKTAVKDGQLNPEYNETFEFEMTEQMCCPGVHEATLTFEVWHDGTDSFLSDDMSAQIAYPLSEFLAAPTAETLLCAFLGGTVTLLGNRSEVGEFGTLTYSAKRAPVVEAASEAEDAVNQTLLDTTNLLSTSEPLCQLAPYFEVATLIKAETSQIAVGLIDSQGVVVVCVDSRGCLCCDSTAADCHTFEKLEMSWKDSTVIGFGIEHDRRGQATGIVHM